MVLRAAALSVFRMVALVASPGLLLSLIRCSVSRTVDGRYELFIAHPVNTVVVALASTTLMSWVM
jgi:hypothetical protein